MATRTGAQQAKAIMNRYKIRLGEKFDKGDALSLEAMNQELSALQEKQEQARLAEEEAAMAFEEGAIETFANGGKLSKKQQQTLSTILANRNTPFVRSAIEGQPTQFRAGLNAVGQYSVMPRQLPGSELPVSREQDLGQAGIQQNAIPFGDQRSARQFARRAPKVIAKGKEQGIFAYGGKIPEKPSLSSTGLAAGKKPAQYSEQQLRLGIDVEFEHTKNKALAMKIAMDHLEENPMYYGTGDKAEAEQLAQQHAADDAAQYAMGGRLGPMYTPVGGASLDQIYTLENGGGLPMYQGGGGFKFPTGRTTTTFTPHAGGGEGSWVEGDFTGGAGAGGDDPFTPFKSRVPYFGALAQGLGSILANRKIDFGDNEIADIKNTKIAPHLVDYTRGREQTMRERDQANALITRGARGTGSQSGLMENIIAGTTGTQRVAGTGFNQSLENEGNVNAQIRNEVAARQQQSDLQTAMVNQRNQRFNQQLDRENLLINEQRRGNMIGGVTNAITGYGKDRLAADQYDQMLQIMAPENYRFGQGEDSALRRWLQVSPTMKRYFNKTDNKLYQG